MKSSMTILGLLTSRSTGVVKSVGWLFIVGSFLMACARDSKRSPQAPAQTGEAVQLTAVHGPLVCRGILVKKNQLEYDFGDRHFSFIGWAHSSIAEQKEAIKMITEMRHAAKAQDCAKVQSLSDTLLNDLRARTLEGDRVFSALDMAYQNHAFSTIGVELSPKEFAHLKTVKANVIDDVDFVTQQIEKVCPGFNGSAIQIVIPGPEFEYAKESNGLVQAVPLEDHDIKFKYIKGVGEETLEFDSRDSGLSPQTLEKINQLDDKPSQEEERELLALEPDPKLKAKLKRLYDGRIEAFASVSPRNHAIIQNLMKLKGNVAIVIGSAHIDDFKTQLDQLCQRSPVNSSNLN